jgi:uncharacterized protein YuzE
MKKKIQTLSILRIDVPPEGDFDDFRDKPPVTYSRSSYDSFGNLLEDIKFNDYGEIIGKSVYQFDKNGKLISEETFDDSDELEEKITFDRDETGKITREFVHYLDDSKDTIEYHYDADGRLVKKQLIGEEGEIEREEIFIYENEFLMKEQTVEDGEVIKESAYEYDEKGNVIGLEMMNENEEFSIVSEFDENGNRIKFLRYDGNGKVIEKHLFAYDSKNNLIETIEETPYKKVTTSVARDEAGNAVLQKEIGRDGKLNHEIERDFDESGNVTEVRSFVSGSGQRPDRKYILKHDYTFFEG